MRQDQPTEAANADLESFRAEARSFLKSHAAPRPGDSREFSWGQGPDRVGLFHEPSPDEESSAVARSREWRRLRFDAGFGWITGPVEYGGRALPMAFERAYDELERGYDTPSQRLVVGPEVMAPALIGHSTAEQKTRWLPGMYRGDLLACLLFSEPGAGSDLAGVTTSAAPVAVTPPAPGRSPDWVANGQKVWTSGAQYADIGLLLARTSPSPRRANLTAFVLEMRSPGVEVRPLRQMTGGSSFNEVFLSDVVIPDTSRVGQRGEGWAVAMTALRNDRGSVGAPGGEGILGTARLIALTRQMGRADDPAVRQALARVVSRLAVTRYARLRVEAKRRAGLIPGPEWSTAKLAFTENLAEVARFLTLVLGARLVADSGEWGTYAWAEHVLGIPGLRIAAGTDEIQRNIIAERVLGLPRDPDTRSLPSSSENIAARTAPRS